MATLKELAAEDWRLRIETYDAEATIVRPEPGGTWIGPLATMTIGMMTDDEDGEVACMDNQDGRNMVAIACMPQFAELVTWAIAELYKLNPIHFDQQSDYGKFTTDLDRRLHWLRALVDERVETLAGGTHELGRDEGK